MVGSRAARLGVLGRVLAWSFAVVLNACGGGSTDGSGVGQPPPASSYTGKILLDDYDWFSFTNAYLGVTELTLSPLSKSRLADGSQGRRHISGQFIYREPCGDDVHRIVSATDQGAFTVLTPCSSAFPNPGFSDTNFQYSALSADGSRLAVEIRWFQNSAFVYNVVVYNTADQSVAAQFDGIEPAWLPDGRLLMVSQGQGLIVADTTLTNVTPFANGLPQGAIRNPALHPSADRIAFEYQQAIWHMNLDGTGLEKIVSGASRLRFPTWSPDGTALAYLATADDDHYDEAIYFVDVASRQTQVLDVSSVQNPTNVSNTISGPMTWTQ